MPPWLRWLRIPWCKAAPVRVILDRPVVVTLPPFLDEDGQPLGMDDLLPELVKAYETCPAVFTWLGREVARKDKIYHTLAPVHDPAAHAAWHRSMEGLNGQLAVLNRALRLPQSANRRILELQKLVEEKKATEAEAKILRDFFEE